MGLHVLTTTAVLLVSLFSFQLYAADELITFYRMSFEPHENISPSAHKWLESKSGIDASYCAKFSISSENSVGEAMLRLPLNVAALRGKAVMLEGMVKAQNLSSPKLNYLGPKLMLYVRSNNGERWLDQNKKYGTYDWTPFSVFARIPKNAEEVTINIGLQGCSGTVWIDDITLKILPLDMPEPNLDIVRNNRNLLPRMRGVMSGHNLGDEDIRVLSKEWGANVIRYQLSNFERQDIRSEETYWKWLNGQLAKMDKILPLCEKYGIKVIIDLHAGPANAQDELLSNRLSWEKESQDLLVEVWEEIGKRYRNNPVVWGYDILNEPREEDYVWRPDGGDDWNHLALRVASALRKVDPVKPIIIEPAMWGGPKGLKNFKPVNVPNVIYSIHFYAPSEFTHQGIGNRPSGKSYPGAYGKTKWNKEHMRQELQPVIDFQKQYGVPVYVGEFSVSRWAPEADALRWLGDLLEIMEENGWDWSYHAFREADCWDAEMSTDRNDKTRYKSTPRLDLLKKYYARNGQETAVAGK